MHALQMAANFVVEASVGNTARIGVSRSLLPSHQRWSWLDAMRYESPSDALRIRSNAIRSPCDADVAAVLVSAP